MRIKEITIAKSVTINLGNYNGTKLEARYTADVDLDENPEDVADELSRQVDDRLIIMSMTGGNDNG